MKRRAGSLGLIFLAVFPMPRSGHLLSLRLLLALLASVPLLGITLYTARVLQRRSAPDPAVRVGGAPPTRRSCEFQRAI